MTLYHEIEAECARLKDCPDTEENAKLGLTFRAVWWLQIRQEIANQAAEIANLKSALLACCVAHENDHNVSSAFVDARKIVNG